MEPNTTAEPDAVLAPRERILQRLSRVGIPQEHVSELQQGLVSLVRKHKPLLRVVVSAILPTDSDVSEALISSKHESQGVSSSAIFGNLFGESSVWLQWLMFEGEPKSFLIDLAQKDAGQRRVCGAVWGRGDLAYHCRTCEHDPTCAICVSCFQNGNHEGHDYSIMYTGGGCCDCGDPTAWKREGFCSKHKGSEQIQPLSEEITSSAGPVLDALFIFWKDKLFLASSSTTGNLRVENSNSLQMLLEFCNCCESLLSFIAKEILNLVGFLELLVRAELFLSKPVVKLLHELMLKLLGEPLFKHEFAKVFIHYYPVPLEKAIKENSDSTFEKCPLLSTFSVQIFTVPTLTPRLVREENLLGVLVECLWNILQSSVDGDGCLQANTWVNIYKSTLHLIEETRYVMTHDEVPKYIVCERPDIIRYWFRILGLVQGIDPQKRVTGLHTEEENESLHLPFIMVHYLWNVQKLLVDGLLSLGKDDGIKSCPSFPADLQDADDGDYLRHAKVGRLSQERSVVYMSRRNNIPSELVAAGLPSIPSHVISLTFRCMKYLDAFLASDITLRNAWLDSGRGSYCNMSNLRMKLFRTRKEASSTRGRKGSYFLGSSPNAYATSSEHLIGSGSSSRTDGVNTDLDYGTEANKIHVCPLDADVGTDSETLTVLSMADWPEIVYDETMKRCYGEGGTMQKINDTSKVHPLGDCDGFFKQVLGNFHPSGFSAFVMEHPLRLRVFCAQVRAGMWRKNGDAGILISEWYRDARWFEIGVEPDLFLLQCCAALAPAEFFVKRILERFDLLNYLSLDLSESSEYEPILVQEMLTVIIQIVTQRRFCGLSAAENLRREIVFKLAVGDATRSQLVKALPQDLSNGHLVQDVIDTVATYSNPSGLKQGRYSLQTTYWKELDLYHPRWRSRDLQVAEERYLRFCKSSALNIQLPQWTHVFYPLSSLCRIATSKSVLQIIRAVLFYAVSTKPSSVSRAPDGVLVTSLHLLSLALDICEKCPCIMNPDVDSLHSSANDGEIYPILKYANEKIIRRTGIGAGSLENQSMLSLLVSLMLKHKDENDHNHGDSRLCDISSLIESLIQKFAQLDATCMDELKILAPHVVCHVQQKNSENSFQSSVSVSDIQRKAKARERQRAILASSKQAYVQEQSTPICSLCRDTDSKSPVSFLILLQKSRLSSFVDRRPPSWDESNRNNDRNDYTTKGKLTTDSTVDFSNPEQDLFSQLLQLLQNAGHDLTYDLQLTDNLAFLDSAREGITSVQLPDMSYDSESNGVSSLLTMEHEIYLSVQTDMHGIGRDLDFLKDVDKFLDSVAAKGLKDISEREPTVVGEAIASLQAPEQSIVPRPAASSLMDASSKLPSKNVKFERFGPINCDGIHISSCGHAVHRECHDRYLFSLKQRHIRRLGFEGVHIVDPEMGELLCPVCRRFANSILPAFPNNVRTIRDSNSASNSGVSSSSGIDSGAFHLPHAISLLRCTAKKVGQARFFEILSGKLGETVEPALEPILRKLCGMYLPNNYDRKLASGHLSYSIILWDTLRYSLITTEIAYRGRTAASSDGSRSELEALYGELQSSNGFILSLLLQVAQASRSQNRLQVLMRFSGIKLLAASICPGLEGNRSHMERQKGLLSSIMERLHTEEVFPDAKFLKQAANPILARDPFSSLIWVLFCLPLPFATSSESFTALVHLFYVVCVIQALITCHSKHDFNISNIGDCPVDDLCCSMGDLNLPGGFLLPMVRRLTLPYLRRCSLLWKMLNSSTSTAPCYDNSQTWDKFTPCLSNESESTNTLSMELNEISELETDFKIRSLEAVLKDKVVHSLALKWCAHFLEFGASNYNYVLYSTPAVPFRLMRLPLLYQDLLQRASRCQNHAAACGAGIGVFLLIRALRFIWFGSRRI
ncbi:unnamed protein product [Spirodela intermedia]|uniref:E3 ubiquitin-protein ligase n=1 Tax=Spirodela intermedia TaxID=51605 RepID=A0A7I8IB45_SPIIN|nr:unnamed protein product [Spirodela intermedia]CAA6654977.1 unnamed protein product [Spirodela intermedia]